MTSTPYMTIAKFGQRVVKGSDDSRHPLKRSLNSATRRPLTSVHEKYLKNRPCSSKKSWNLKQFIHKQVKKDLFMPAQPSFQALQMVSKVRRFRKRRMQPDGFSNNTQTAYRFTIDTTLPPSRQSVSNYLYTSKADLKTEFRPSTACKHSKDSVKSSNLMRPPISVKRRSQNTIGKENTDILTPWSSNEDIKVN